MQMKKMYKDGITRFATDKEAAYLKVNGWKEVKNAGGQNPTALSEESRGKGTKKKEADA